MKGRILGLLLLALLPLGGCAAVGGARTPDMAFRYAENQTADYPTTQAAYFFADRVAELSDGRIRIYVYPDAELGDERSVIEQLQYGGIDFSRVSISPLSEYDSRLHTLQLPYLYRDSEHMWAVLGGEIGDRYLAGLADIGLVGLGWMDAGARNFYTRDALVHTPEDMRGLRIRVQENAMMEELVSLLGAVPEQMRYSEVLPALQTGKVDGAENSYPSYHSTGHYLVAKHLVEDEHSRIPEVIVASQAVMDKLSEADQAILRTAAAEASIHQRALWLAFEATSRALALESGCVLYTVTPEEKALFQETTAQMYAKYAGDDMETIEVILAMGQEIR